MQEAVLDLGVEQVLSPALDGGEQRVRADDDRARHPDRGDRHRARALGRGRAHVPAAARGRATRCSRSSTRRRASTASSRGAAATTTSTSRATMRELADDIESGRFADEWDAERDAGYPTLTRLKEQHAGPGRARVRSRSPPPARTQRDRARGDRGSTMDRVRIGIVGVGNIATLNVPGLPRSTSSATSSRCAIRAPTCSSAGRASGASTARYTELDALLADPDIDAVEILGPTPLHAEHVIAAARAGKHVIVQKPIANTVSDARRMVQAADDAGVIFRVTEQALLLPAAAQGARPHRVGDHRRPDRRADQDRRRPHRVGVPGQPRSGRLLVALQRPEPGRPSLRRRDAQVRDGAVARRRARCAACRRSCARARCSSRRRRSRCGSTRATTCSG